MTIIAYIFFRGHTKGEKMTKLTELKKIEKNQDTQKLHDFCVYIMSFNVGHRCFGSALRFLYNSVGKELSIVLLFKLGYISALQDNNLLSKDAEPKEKGRVIFKILQ